MREAEREILGSGKKSKKTEAQRDSSKPRPRSLHHIDDEDYRNESSEGEKKEIKQPEEAQKKNGSEPEEKAEAKGRDLIGKAKLKDDKDGR